MVLDVAVLYATRVVVEDDFDVVVELYAAGDGLEVGNLEVVVEMYAMDDWLVELFTIVVMEVVVGLIDELVEDATTVAGAHAALGSGSCCHEHFGLAKPGSVRL